MAALAGLWALLWAVALLSRPLWPVDETRYASVAWEMWLGGNWLVPHLNGVPYSDKPPLLFWLICLGWSAFGTGSLWLRFLPALFAPVGLFLTAALARELWPDDPRAAQLAPLMLLGSALWLFFCTPVMFDMLLASCVLAALWGVVAARRLGVWGWSLAGVSLGLGILAKGPVALVYTVPVAVLGPWWIGTPYAVRWGRWFAGLGAALLLAAAFALCWVVPAALSGGGGYAQAILWGQTAHRVVEATAHRQPWWWYLPLLPALLLPWSLWPTLWRAVRAARDADPGVRFCAAWALPTLVLLSAISGKQVHYLIPLTPAFALAGARVLSDRHPSPGDGRVPALLLGLFALMTLSVRYLGPDLGLPGWTARVPLGLVAVLTAGAAILARGLWGGIVARTFSLTTAGVLAAAAVYAVGVRAAAPYYDVTPTAERLGRLQAQGHPIAYVGNYHGEFHFAGRLHRPVAVLHEVREAVDWLCLHPNGRVVMPVRDWSEVPDLFVEHEQAYRGEETLVILGPVQRTNRCLLGHRV